MAKTRRSLSSIAKGVRSSFANALKFGSNRRREVLSDLQDEYDFEEQLESEFGPAGDLEPEQTENIRRSPINNPVPPMEDFTNDKTSMEELARRAFELNKIEEMRTMFLLLINNYTKELNENPSNSKEIQDKLNERKAQLTEFDNAITIIKSEEQINNINESTNRILESLNEDFEKLIEYLDDLDNKEFNLNVLIMNIENKLSAGLVTQTGYQVGTYLNNIALVKELNERYKDLTGYDYKSTISINYFSENQIRKIYGEIESKIRVLQNKIEQEQDLTEIPRLKGIIENLDNLIQYLPTLLSNPRDFSKIKSETDTVLDRAFGKRKDLSSISPSQTQPNPQPAPAPSENNPPKSNSLFVIMAEQHMKKIYEKIRGLASEFKVTDQELQELIENFNLEVSKITNISEEEKNNIIGNIEERYNKKLMDEFGAPVYNFICTYSNEFESKLEKLNSCEYGTQNFEEAYKELRNLINEMNTIGSADNINVLFDEEKQSVHIYFPTDKIKPVVRQVVSDNVLSMINNKANENNHEKEIEIMQFTNEMEALYTEYDQELENVIRTLPEFSNLPTLDKKLASLLNDEKKYTRLSYTEKCKIKEEVEGIHNTMLDAKIGYDFMGFVYSVVLKEMNKIDFKSIEKYKYGTLKFDLCYKELLDSVQTFRKNVLSSPGAENFISNISFDDNTQVIRIDYNNKVIKSFERPIISNEILAQINAGKMQQQPSQVPSGQQPAPAPQPVPPVQPVPPIQPNPRPINPLESDVIRDYINKVNEVNYLVEMLNEINSKLEAQAIINFLDSNNIKMAISLEREAKALDEQLINLKLELSRDRIEIKKKHNIFVNSLPEVKSIPIQKINFSGELAEFVRQHDEMIVDAEQEILSLDFDRKNNAHNEEELDNINAKISELVEFIDSQNSLIGRRLVSEAQNIDIVEFLKNRQEKKKDMRERLRRIKDEKITKPVAQPQPVNSDLEKEYTEKASMLADKLLEECIIITREKLIFDATSLFNNSTNYSALKNLALDPKYSSINVNEIEKIILESTYLKYDEIVRIENLKAIVDFSDRIFTIMDNLSDEELKDDNLINIVNQKIEAEKKSLFSFNQIEYTIDLEDNSYTLRNNGHIYYFDEKMFGLGVWERKLSGLMNENMFARYQNYKNSPSNDIDNDKSFIMSNSDLMIPVEAIRDVGLYIIYNDKVLLQNYNDLASIVKHKYSITKEQFDVIIDSLEKNNVIFKDENSLNALMSQNEFLDLIANLQDVKPIIKDTPVDENSPTEPEIKISTRQLSFNPKKQKQFADREKDFIRDGDSVTISIIKNGVKIKYSQELREKLSELNAKISLVNKKNYRMRATESIPAAEEEQELGFKDEREIKPDDYRIEIRIPDKEKSSVLFEYDLEKAEEDIKSRTK